MKYRFRRIIWSFILWIALFVGINAWIILGSWNDVMHPDYEWYDVGLVLWASVTSDWLLSPILQTRVDKALQLYNDGTISKIIVSGYDKNSDHLEAISMADYLLASNVPDEDILIDGGWYDTLASIQRVELEFEINKVIIFTQRYHLWRSLWYARSSWLDAVWYAVDDHDFQWKDLGTSREILARIKAFGEVLLWT